MEKIYESHSEIKSSELPFIFHMDIVRNTTVHPHWHENIEFLCCFEGSGTVLADSEEIKMNSGDTIIINSKHIHSITSDKSAKYYCLIIDNSFFEDNGININLFNFKNKITDPQITQFMLRIHDTYINLSSDFYIAENRTALSIFMTYVTKKYSFKIEYDNTPSKSHIAVLNAIDYINNNYSKKLLIDEISKNSGYSKYHFTRIFKETTGYTIVDHINATRCEKAKKMLIDTTEPISKISIDCGFEQASYFTKTFKKYYHCLPIEFRKKYSKKQ